MLKKLLQLYDGSMGFHNIILPTFRNTAIFIKSRSFKAEKRKEFRMLIKRETNLRISIFHFKWLIRKLHGKLLHGSKAYRYATMQRRFLNNEQCRNLMVGIKSLRPSDFASFLVRTL